VVGLLDASLSEKMLLDPELTLDKALSMACQSEAICKQQPVVRGTAQQDSHVVEQETKVDALGHSNSKNVPRRDKSHPGGRQPLQTKCSRCGKAPKHSKQQCPARDTTCKKCHKKGHYSSYCFSRNINFHK